MRTDVLWRCGRNETEYFLTTERLGFSWWTEMTLELANGLWEDPQVCLYICAAGQFSDDDNRKRLALEMENGQHHHVQYWLSV